MFHPDFRPRPHLSVPPPSAGDDPIDLVASINRVGDALDERLAAGAEPMALGDQLADLVRAAIDRMPSAQVVDRLGLYPELVAMPRRCLAHIHNQYLTEECHHLGVIRGNL